MYKSILIMPFLFLSSCITSTEKSPKFIGYGLHPCQIFTEPCGMDKPNGDYEAWVFHRGDKPIINADPLKTFPNSFFLYVKMEIMNKGGMGPRTKEVIRAGQVPLYDMGGNCMSFIQTGKDTILIDKKPVIMSIPIEPCVPYTTKG